MRKNRKNSSKPHNKDTGPLPGKPRQRFFVPSSSPNREGPCWPLCGPLCRFRTQGRKRTQPRPPRPGFGPARSEFGKASISHPREGCEKRAGERAGAENRRLPRATAPGRAGRKAIFPWGHFWLFPGSDFAPWSQSWGQDNQNYPAASHFPRRYRRGQRKDETLWKKKKT